jgi:hypothetical protein
MLRSLKELNNYTIEATDGDIGHVYGFFFQDFTWTIRYLVVDTGKWLPGRRVLVAPIALGEAHWDTKRLTVNLTQEQVRNSPDMDTDKPVSRQYELALYQHYSWPIYWGPTDVVSDDMPPPLLAEARLEEEGNTHLHSSREVVNYYIHAQDGDLGHVEDFIIDDDAWVIRYVVIQTHNWLPGKSVLVAMSWISEISWIGHLISVDLTRDEIKNCPEFDPDEPVNRAYEEVLYDYHGRPKYWTS